MFYKALEIQLEKFKGVKWDGGLARSGRGHTVEANKHEVCHCGRTSSAWYAILALGGQLNDTVGLDILLALEELQNKDEKSPTYGCSRWYAEETRVIDTNAAFFAQLPLVDVMLFDKEKVPAAHQEVINRIFATAIHWYEREMDNPIYYYSNKILSDGAMSIGISKIIGNDVAFEKALNFFENWLEYTEKDGWGWGENMSIGYNSVIFAAIKTAILALGDSEREKKVKEGLERILDEQKKLFVYFKGYEFTPAIRNYNFEGNSRRVGPINRISGFATSVESLSASYVWDFVTFIYLFKNEFTEERRVIPEKDIDIRETKVYKDAVAYSCVMKNGSIGSMNKFPVIEGSYQHKTWGLGWQSMPVNFCVYGGQVGYLRRIVQNEKETVYHPKHAYLSPCLFSDAPYPHVLTRSKQEKNIVITKRSIEKINNMVGELSDELLVPSFSGEIKVANVNGREWAVISYKSATVFVSATKGVICPQGELFTTEGRGRTSVSMEVTLDGDLSIKQTAFKNDEVIRFCSERVELGWIMIYEDRAIENPEEYLAAYEITDKNRSDGRDPREGSYTLHDIAVKKNGETLIDYTYDPYI